MPARNMPCCMPSYIVCMHALDIIGKDPNLETEGDSTHTPPPARHENALRQCEGLAGNLQ